MITKKKLIKEMEKRYGELNVQEKRLVEVAYDTLVKENKDGGAKG